MKEKSSTRKFWRIIIGLREVHEKSQGATEDTAQQLHFTQEQSRSKVKDNTWKPSTKTRSVQLFWKQVDEQNSFLGR